MPEMTVQDSETTKKCSKDFNLLFESIPRFNKDIKEGPIYSIRRVPNIEYSVNCLWRVNSPCDLANVTLAIEISYLEPTKVLL